MTGTRLGSLTVPKLTFGNGETEVISLGDAAIERVVAVLKAVAPKFDAIEALPTIVDPETGRITASSDSEWNKSPERRPRAPNPHQRVPSALDLASVNRR